MPATSSAAKIPQYQEVAEEKTGAHGTDAGASGRDRKKLPGSGDSVVPCAPLSTDIGHAWLAWQCRMIAGIIRGTLYLPVDERHIGFPISTWPCEGEGEAQLLDAATQALEQDRGLLRAQQRYGPGNHRTCDLIACPLKVAKETVAVVSVMISTRSEPQQHAVLQLLQWGGLWMETLVRQEATQRRDAGSFSLALMTAILAQPAFHAAAMEAANRLADQLRCERVSLGLRRGLPIRLDALSHVAGFDPRTQLVRGIEAAMEEAVDQAQTIVHPGKPERDTLLTRAHTELAQQQGNGALCTVALPGRSGIIGAITLERDAGRPFDKDTVHWCEALARAIGPALELKKREERSLWFKGGEALRERAASLFGPSRLKLKAAILSGMTLLAALLFVDGDYKVTAPAGIEGAVRQILVAPQEGYVKEAQVRAGDLVSEGQLVATLDDRSLQLERRKWQSERNKIEKEYQDALAKRDRTELSVLRARIDQVAAELRLVEDKIGRTRLRAPFDGIVVSGDLSQSLGTPVETGQVLFEVAPLDSYRVVLEVDEHDVAGLDSGRPGHLIIAALPRTSFAVTLDRVVPVAVSGEAGNYFRVEASLNEPSPLLRPGMQGVAKIEMGRRKLLWIWTHAVFDRLRLWAWSAGL